MLVSRAAVVATAMTVCAASPQPALPLGVTGQNGRDEASLPDLDVFQEMSKALSDMQDTYFQRWVGTWPRGNDWTRAVVNTHVVAALRTMSDEVERRRPDGDAECAVETDEVIAGYFADVIAYYFGEDAFAIRHEAYDDMLWVVLGWLEAIQFVNEHGELLSSRTFSSAGSSPGSGAWYGGRWIPAFAHRARIFWELAARGWDTKLCGGGMIWNPRLLPYKNAITNQLFISASIGMYLHFPGDPNRAPFGGGGGGDSEAGGRIDWRPHDPVFGKAAQDAHRWLASSNMTNAQGLYADGFHISGYRAGRNNTRCDQRDEMVYTYNQGVLLSGLLGLYQATGRERYLREGHALVESVIRATGYHLARDEPIPDEDEDNNPRKLPRWHGLGRAGVLEEACDASATCSQDAQTFKGIWMHHFAAFCAPGALRHVRSAAGDAGDAGDAARARARARARHAADCRRYVPWVRRNARAALATRDAGGRFGMWWTPGLLGPFSPADAAALAHEDGLPPERGGADVVDYRNWGVPRDGVWMPAGDAGMNETAGGGAGRGGGLGQKPMGSVGRADRGTDASESAPRKREPEADGPGPWDPNLRGRGRTVETQAGGLAVLRALWVVSRNEL